MVGRKTKQNKKTSQPYQHGGLSTSWDRSQVYRSHGYRHAEPVSLKAMAYFYVMIDTPNKPRDPLLLTQCCVH